VRAHDEHSLTGAVSPVSDVDSMVGELVARVSGFGPLQPYLDDPSVEEVWINAPVKTFGAGQTPIFGPRSATSPQQRTAMPPQPCARTPVGCGPQRSATGASTC
jgi:hypothetical protein